MNPLKTMAEASPSFEPSRYSKRVYFSKTSRFYHGQRMSKLVRICRTCGGRRALEIGCNDLLFYALLNHRYDVYAGIDTNGDSGTEVGKRNIKACRWHNVELHIGKAEDLPFADEEFDRVFCFETLEHVADGERAASEIERVLAPRGILIISLPIEFGLGLVLKELLRPFVYRHKSLYCFPELFQAGLLCDPGRVEREPKAHKGFDYRAMARTLRDKGFRILETYKLPLARLPDIVNLGVIIVLQKP